MPARSAGRKPMVERLCRYRRVGHNAHTRIDPIFENVPEIAARVVPAKSREAGNTTTHKRFPKNRLQIPAANP